MKVLAIVERDNLVVDEIPSQVNVMSHDKRSILLKVIIYHFTPSNIKR